MSDFQQMKSNEVCLRRGCLKKNTSPFLRSFNLLPKTIIHFKCPIQIVGNDQ